MITKVELQLVLDQAQELYWAKVGYTDNGYTAPEAQPQLPRSTQAAIEAVLSVVKSAFEDLAERVQSLENRLADLIRDPDSSY